MIIIVIKNHGITELCLFEQFFFYFVFFFFFFGGNVLKTVDAIYKFYSFNVIRSMELQLETMNVYLIKAANNKFCFFFFW